MELPKGLIGIRRRGFSLPVVSHAVKFQPTEFYQEPHDWYGIRSVLWHITTIPDLPETEEEYRLMRWHNFDMIVYLIPKEIPQRVMRVCR